MHRPHPEHERYTKEDISKGFFRSLETGPQRSARMMAHPFEDDVDPHVNGSEKTSRPHNPDAYAYGYTYPHSKDMSQSTMDKISEATKEVAHKVADTAGTITDATKNTVRSATDAVGSAAAQVGSTISHATKTAVDGVGNIGDKLYTATHNVGGSQAPLTEKLKETAGHILEDIPVIGHRLHKPHDEYQAAREARDAREVHYVHPQSMPDERAAPGAIPPATVPLMGSMASAPQSVQKTSTSSSNVSSDGTGAIPSGACRTTLEEYLSHANLDDLPRVDRVALHDRTHRTEPEVRREIDRVVVVTRDIPIETTKAIPVVYVKEEMPEIEKKEPVKQSFGHSGAPYQIGSHDHLHRLDFVTPSTTYPIPHHTHTKVPEGGFISGLTNVFHRTFFGHNAYPSETTTQMAPVESRAESPTMWRGDRISADYEPTGEFLHVHDSTPGAATSSPTEHYYRCGTMSHVDDPTDPIEKGIVDALMFRKITNDSRFAGMFGPHHHHHHHASNGSSGYSQPLFKGPDGRFYGSPAEYDEYMRHSAERAIAPLLERAPSTVSGAVNGVKEIGSELANGSARVVGSGVGAVAGTSAGVLDSALDGAKRASQATYQGTRNVASTIGNTTGSIIGAIGRGVAGVSNGIVNAIVGTGKAVATGTNAVVSGTVGATKAVATGAAQLALTTVDKTVDGLHNFVHSDEHLANASHPHVCTEKPAMSTVSYGRAAAHDLGDKAKKAADVVQKNIGETFNYEKAAPSSLGWTNEPTKKYQGEYIDPSVIGRPAQIDPHFIGTNA